MDQITLGSPHFARCAYSLPCFAIQLKAKNVMMPPKNNVNQSIHVSFMMDILSSNSHKLLKISTLATIKATSENTSVLFFIDAPVTCVVR